MTAQTLTEARVHLASALADVCTVPVYPDVPAQLVPPCNIVLPADPWLSGRDTFAGLGIVHFDVVCLTGTALDAAALAAVEHQALEVASGCDFDTLSAPQRRQYGDRLYLAVTVRVTLTV